MPLLFEVFKFITMTSQHTKNRNRFILLKGQIILNRPPFIVKVFTLEKHPV